MSGVLPIGLFKNSGYSAVTLRFVWNITHARVFPTILLGKFIVLLVDSVAHPRYIVPNFDRVTNLELPILLDLSAN